MVRVTRADRAALRLPWRALLGNKLHEFRVKARGKRIKGQGMIGAETPRVLAGFEALAGQDFEEYNLPQVWVERRQIPQAIDGRIPVKGAVVLDLGCGPGTSTQVLCHFADPSWTILGFDFVDHYVASAAARSRRGEFRNREGVVIRPRFTCQSIAEPLMDDQGVVEDARVAAQSVDFAISGGVVGLYLSPRQAGDLVRELWRVVKRGGYIALDAGPSVPEATLRALANEAGFEQVSVARSFVIEPRPKLVFVKPRTR